MNPMSPLRVELGDCSYSILIGQGLLGELLVRLNEQFPNNRHGVLIYDERVADLARRVHEQLTESPQGEKTRRITTIEIPSGEESKSVAVLQRIWKEMLDARTDRGSVVLALGGGVVGDLAGFAAATFARGIPLVQLPTTLLSQVDSSVGGKTGINLPGAKNIVGAFWQPSLVIIDTKTLATLPEREFLSGLAEVAKYGVILLPELFTYLERNADRVLARNPETLRAIITESCRAKAQVVENDERETNGLRAALNYGHTFAHAIEATEGYGRWLHGEAVAIGMHMAAHLARLLRRVDDDFVERQARLLQNLQLPIELPNANADLLWEAMQHDKKVQHGTIRFILPEGQLGKVNLVSGITKDQVAEAVRKA